MYEDLTYENILDRMMYRVPDKYDKREGSLIYNALAPAAVELLQMYINLDRLYTEAFAVTASRDYLVMRAAERGLSIEPETFAIRKGEFDIPVPIGSRFNLNALNYVVAEEITTGIYKLQCETAGRVGNLESGYLIPIETIDGLKSAMLTDVLVPGEDEEDTEDYRQRYLNSFDSQAFGGNIADYKEKVSAIGGVGSVKVYPVWNGGGTVKLVILDAEFNAPSSILVDGVQAEVDPTQNAGEGMGLAPIGHVVTVMGAQTHAVDIATTITYQVGYDWDTIKTAAEQAIDGYYKELAHTWADSQTIVVRISQIETRLLALEGVVDIADTRLDGAQANVQLGPDEIPTRGDFDG